MPTTLFRPIGLQELALLWDSGMRQFPERLVHQSIFYPVLNLEYARQIARDWNTPDANSGFAGFVMKFEVSSSYLSKYEIHTAGSAAHREYWIPAKDLNSFNKAINGLISVEEAFFGPSFVGYMANDNSLKNLDAMRQFSVLSQIEDQRSFVAEVSVNRKAVFLNFPFWLNTDVLNLGCSPDQRNSLVGRLQEAWEANNINLPLPVPLSQ